MEQELQEKGRNGELEEPGGRPIHFGNLLFFVLLVLSGLLILIFGGWRRLWWLLPLGGGVWLFFFLLALWEDRWRIVTPDAGLEDASEMQPSPPPAVKGKPVPSTQPAPADKKGAPAGRPPAYDYIPLEPGGPEAGSSEEGTKKKG